jgi:hypothetical protein
MNTSFKQMYFFQVIIVSVILIISGIVFIVGGIGYIDQKSASEQWLSTNGIVLSSNMSVLSWYEYVHRVGMAPRTSYIPHITYQYTVNNILYTSSNISLENKSSDVKRDTEALIERYQPGQNVTVYYNPTNPTQAILETSASRGQWLLIVGIILIVVGAISLAFILRILRDG